ncbi:MAG: DoxX family protein [Cyanobacteria bacterium P01_H01_bin.119]
MEMVGILIARLMLSAIFAQSALGKILDPTSTQAFMQSKGIPGILIWPTIAVLVVGTLSIVLGYKARIGAWLLIGFLIPTTLIFHVGAGEQIAFLKNLGLIGGLLMVAVVGSGSISIDGKTA